MGDRLPVPAEAAETEEPPAAGRKAATAAPRLAPGQKWDPDQKIKFAAPKRAVQRPGVVFVLDEQMKPAGKKVLLGITDGSATEVVSGEIKSGDNVIIGDGNQTQTTQTQGGNPAPFFGGLGRGGGRGGRGN